MEPIGLRELAELCGAVSDRTLPDISVTQVTNNTRVVIPGAVFVPLKGMHADGHDFIADAAARGAAAALCSREDVTADIPLLRVPDTLKAAQTLAAAYRRRFSLPVIGVTGSAGKTTTVAMTCAALGSMRPLRTADADNGQIGMTFTLFNLDASYGCAVLEMGMSLPGELARLSEMGRPDIAVINGIGTAHIEFFGTREKIRDAKLEILSGMPEDGILIFNGDDPLLWDLKGALPRKTLFYAQHNPAADFLAACESTDGVSVLQFTKPFTKSMTLHAVGSHYCSDALAAVAAAYTMGAAPDAIAEGLNAFESVPGRQRIVEKCGVTVMEDWYNASPEAVQASLGVLSALAPVGKRFAALGCMRELGDASLELHRACGEYAAKCCDYLFVYGDGAEGYLEGAENAGMPCDRRVLFTSHDALVRRLYELCTPGSAVLFKGSHHFTHMERAMEAFYALLES